MDGAKSPFQSLTIASAASAALVNVLALLGVGIDPALADQASTQVAQIVSAVLALVAVYGRYRASRRIGRDA